MSRPHTPLRVAVGDRDPVVLTYLQLLVARLGHTVAFAAGSPRVLADRCRADRPDVVVAGASAATDVGEVGVPVVVLTGGGQAAAFAARPGVAACLPKPFLPDDLRRAIRDAARDGEAAGGPPGSPPAVIRQ